MDSLTCKVARIDGLENLTLRGARVFDAGEVLALINSYASSNLMLPRELAYFYENIRDFVVVEVVKERAEPKIVSCGSLHVLSKDVAEIRSLAVHLRFWRRGLGSKIVRYLVEEARQMEIEKVFAFTLKKDFFEKLGFKPKTKEELPFEVWRECIQCPKYLKCDEVGLIFDCTE